MDFGSKSVTGKFELAGSNCTFTGGLPVIHVCSLVKRFTSFDVKAFQLEFFKSYIVNVRVKIISSNHKTKHYLWAL